MVIHIGPCQPHGHNRRDVANAKPANNAVFIVAVDLKQTVCGELKTG